MAGWAVERVSFSIMLLQLNPEDLEIQHSPCWPVSVLTDGSDSVAPKALPVSERAERDLINTIYLTGLQNVSFLLIKTRP